VVAALVLSPAFASTRFDLGYFALDSRIRRIAGSVLGAGWHNRSGPARCWTLLLTAQLPDRLTAGGRPGVVTPASSRSAARCRSDITAARSITSNLHTTTWPPFAPKASATWS